MNQQPVDLHRAIEAAKSLRLELARILMTGGDPDAEVDADTLQTLQDTFDGETTLEGAIREAVLMIDEDEIFIAGIKAREETLKARRQRLEKRIEATRGLIEQAMTVANWDKHEMDIGTVSIGKVAPRVEIDEESEIPVGFWKPQDPTLDKKALGDALKARQKKLDEIAKLKTPEEREAALTALNSETPPIPGCHLEIGGTTLKIRRS